MAITAALMGAIETIPKRYSMRTVRRPVTERASDGFTRGSQSKTRMLTIAFEVILHVKGIKKESIETLILDIGPGDALEPVITIGFPADF